MLAFHPSPLELKKYWYIAAETRALKRRPIARTVLGEPIVLFRAAASSPAALSDSCAHRGMALSRGRVTDGLLECPTMAGATARTAAVRGFRR